MKRIHALGFLSAIISSCIILFLYYQEIPFLERLEGNTLDLMFAVRGQQRPDPAIAIIAIDEKSLGELGRWPWSRRHWSAFLNNVRTLNPRLLILDVWFSEQEAPDVDLGLQNAITASQRAVLPIVFELNSPTSAADIAFQAIPGDLVSGSAPLVEGTGVIASLPAFNRAARGIGHINITPDYDGTIRWTPLLIRHKGHVFPSLALAASRVLLAPEQSAFLLGERIVLGRSDVLTDEASRMLINYTGPPGTYPYHSFVDVMQGRVSADHLRDKILFIGATAQGIYDMRATPYSPNTPGVEVNATITDNILNRTFLVRRPPDRLFDMVFILAAGGLFGIIIPRVRAAFALPFAVTVAIGYSALAYHFFRNGHWLSTVYPVLSLVFAYLSSSAVRLFAGERRVQEIRKMFSNYVSKQVVDELIRDPEKARLGGQQKEITILFSDLKGFTGFSEKHSPREVVSILNEYFAVMADCIIEYNGTLDKFLGDGIMAFWNAPLDQEKHPELAVRCGLEMARRFARLQERWKRESRELLDFGIGINTGEVIIGNVGVAGKKMEYTAIGDQVNITHRIQDQTRVFQRSIIITGNCFEKVREIVDAEELGPVFLKGKEEAVVIYAVKGLR